MGKANRRVLWILSKLSVKLATMAVRFMISTTNFSKSNIGPFELADFIGLDKAKTIMGEIFMKIHTQEGKKYKESQLLNYLISEGKLGRKTGEGFYVYNRLPSNKIVVRILKVARKW